MNYFSLYYLYIKNIFENQLDNFFCSFHSEEALELSNWKLSVYEFYDVFIYLFSLRFNEFFFFLSKLLENFKKRNSYIFFFFFLISDIFSFMVFYLVSHSWLSLKIYNDYVHNYSRRNVLKILTLFFLIFSIMFLVFSFYII
jgi:hypothetical protein